jgi:hypothetical protein
VGLVAWKTSFEPAPDSNPTMDRPVNFIASPNLFCVLYCLARGRLPADPANEVRDGGYTPNLISKPAQY